MLALSLYKNPRYLALLILAILSIGYTSISSLGRQEDPTITPFIAKVQTFFPGASPTRMETLITKPLEDAIREIPEIVEISSTSSSGVSVIIAEVAWSLPQTDIDRVFSELRDVVAEAAATFPAGAMPPDIDDDLITAFVKIVAISGKDGRELPPAILQRETERFADAARLVPNTKRVQFFGMPVEEVRIVLDENKLATLGVSVAEVSRALASADVRTPAGKLNGPSNSLTVEVAGEFEDLETIRQVQVRALSDGRVLRLGDIASIEKSERDPLGSIAFSNGERSVLLGIEMDLGYQVDTYSDRFDRFFTQYQKEAPAGIQLEISYDQVGYTRDRLRSVFTNLLLGVSLVLAVLLFTLGWRAALVVAVVLPLCTLVSMIGLLYLEVPIHQMSLTGLVVALGLLVDGSIVMADEVRKRLIEGLSPTDAMLGSIDRLRVPLISSTATTVLAFLPMAILDGPPGDFLGSIATSVVVMLIASGVLALTITPVLAARLLPSGIRDDHHWWLTGIELPAVSERFRTSLDWSLQNPLGAIALAMALPMTGFVTSSTLTNQFFPGTDRDQFYLQITMPSNASIDDSIALSKRIDADLRAEPLIRRVDWTVGESAPAFYYNMRSNKRGLPEWMEALVLTTDENQTDDLIRRLQIELDNRYPQAQIIVRGIDQGPPVDAPLEVSITGPNLRVLQELGEAFRRRMASIPDVTHTKMSMAPSAPKLVFDLDEAKLRQAGLTRVAVAEAINGALRGRVGGELLEDTERLPVRAILNRADWSNITEITSLRITTRSAEGSPSSIPLAALGSPKLMPDDTVISREQGVRENEVQGFLTRGVLPEEALKLLQKSLEQNPIAMPIGYDYSFGGDSDERAAVINDLMAPLGIIVSALIATILLTFNSWRLTGVAFLVCIGSFGLSFLALAIFRYPLGVNAVIGVIGSIGVSINAAIIILTGLQQDARACRGDIVAIRDVVIDSSRHIVSTTVTTFGGFLPLILEGSQFWPPFAMSIAGGVLLSTFISFYLVPPLYLVTLGRSDTLSPFATQAQTA